MPLVRYICLDASCGEMIRIFFKDGLAVSSEIKCSKCEGPSKRCFGGPSVSSRLIVDNGLQAKAVEIYPDQVEIFKDHSKNGAKKE